MEKRTQAPCHKYRQLNNDEVIAVTTYNCCANALLDNLTKLERRLRESGHGRMIGLLKGANKTIANVVQTIIEESPDPDQRQMVINRMSRLKLQFGHVRKHPEDLVIMTKHDAEIVFAPLLEKCDLECHCITYDADGNRIGDAAMVKSCETRKALKRIGLSEVGLSSDCPYQILTGKSKD